MPFDPLAYAQALLRGEATNLSLSAPNSTPHAADSGTTVDPEWLQQVVSLGVPPEWAKEARERLNATTENYKARKQFSKPGATNADRVREWRARNPGIARERNVEYQRRYREKHRGDESPDEA